MHVKIVATPDLQKLVFAAQIICIERKNYLYRYHEDIVDLQTNKERKCHDDRSH